MSVNDDEAPMTDEEVRRLHAIIRALRVSLFDAYAAHAAALVERDEAEARGFRAGLEAAAAVVDGGRFLHDDEPDARWARVCAAAIRSVTR